MNGQVKPNKKHKTFEKFLKRILIEIPLSKVGKFLIRKTNKEDLKSLIRSLHPIECESPLIRFGPNTDGGYLIPNDLDGIEACFSPGVSQVSGFEKDCASHGIKVFLADNSVDNPAEQDELFDFTKKFIGSFSNENFTTIEDWVNTSLPQNHSDLILQMDIESFEYETILSFPEELMKRFRIIVIEFHQLKQLHNSSFFFIANRAFQKILNHHKCVHIHPNNIANTSYIDSVEIIDTMEFTFLRRDRIKNEEKFAKNSPHPLDFDNSLIKPSKDLPKNWFRS